MSGRNQTRQNWCRRWGQSVVGDRPGAVGSLVGIRGEDEDGNSPENHVDYKYFEGGSGEPATIALRRRVRARITSLGSRVRRGLEVAARVAVDSLSLRLESIDSVAGWEK